MEFDINKSYIIILFAESRIQDSFDNGESPCPWSPYPTVLPRGPCSFANSNWLHNAPGITQEEANA